MHVRTNNLRAFAAAALLAVSASAAEAQAFSYPAFQAPRVTSREFNFGLADSDGDGFRGDATTLLFQWREARGTRSQLSLDLGVTSVDYGRNDLGEDVDDDLVFFGGQFAHQLTTSTADMPFDLLLTVGANFARGDDLSVFRVPVGVSAGHRFPLEGAMSLTPYLHPRLAFARWDAGIADDSDLGIEFDLGVDFEFTPAFSLRLATTFGDDDTFVGDSFGVSLAWRPGRSR